MIIIGLDDSKVSEAILELAEKHAKAFSATVVIIISFKGGPDIPRKAFVKAEKRLLQTEAFFSEKGIRCEGHLPVRGLEPGEDIVRFAEEKNAEEIIIGVKRRSRVGKLLFGSNAQYVILNAPCPVVTVK